MVAESNADGPDAVGAVANVRVGAGGAGDKIVGAGNAGAVVGRGSTRGHGGTSGSIRSRRLSLEWSLLSHPNIREG